jgi:hypothetical protein
MTVTPVEPIAEDAACNVDRSCATAPDSTCGCNTSSGVSDQTSSRRGAKTALLAVACAAACLAVPLAAGGLAAASGALAGEWWIVALAVVATGIGATVMVRRRNRAGKVC